MIIFERYDDLDYARDKTKTLATHIGVVVGWEGRQVRLDLSDASYQALSDQFGPLMRAGEPAQQDRTRKSASSPAAARTGKSGRRPDAYYAGLVEWVKASGIVKKDGTGRLAYEGRNGRNDYPDWLIRDYDAHLAQPAA